MNSNDRYEVSRMTLIIFSAMQTYLLPNNSLLKMLSWARTKRWKPTKKKNTPRRWEKMLQDYCSVLTFI